MNGILRFVDSLFGTAPRPTNVVVLKQRPATSTARHQTGSRIVVQRNPRPYWQESGWQYESGNYAGEYATPYGRWPGSITVSPGGRIEVYIHNPPAQLERHPHWECFNKRDNGWYFIHANSPIKDVSAAILNVEKTITEAYEN